MCDNLEWDIDLQNILNAQTDIGWDLLRFGFVATAWKNTQHEWEKHRDPNYNSKRSERWSRQLQELLWEYVSAVWDHRNKLVHGKDHQENMSKRLYLLQQEATKLVQNPPALGATNRHLLQLRNIDKQRGQQLHHWIWAIRAVTRRETLRRQKDERNKIMEYMAAVRRQQRIRTPRVLQQ